MPPKACGCNQHSTFSKDCEPVSLYRISSNKYKRVIKDTLIARGFLTTSASFLCTSCASYTEKHLISIPENILEDLLAAIERGKLDKDNLLKLCKIIGPHLLQEISQDSDHISSTYTDTDSPNFDPATWIKERPETLITLLSNITNFYPEDIASYNWRKRCAVLCRVIEDIYFLQSPNIITPFAFALNTLSYFVSGSKTVHNIHSHSSPCGSFNSLQKFLDKGASTPIECPTSGTVTAFFDNNQVLQRNWRVTLSYKSKCSVITNIIFIHNPLNTLQKNPTLSPFQWLLKPTLSQDAVLEKLGSFSDHSKTVIRNISGQFIDTCLQRVRASVQHTDTGIVDDIDIDDVRVEDSTFKSSEDPYAFVDSEHPPHPPPVLLGDPVLVNPAGYENVCVVLNSLCTQTSVGDQREWIAVGCDGSPYNLICRIIDNWFVCPVCGKEIKTGVIDFDKHTLTHEGANIDFAESRFFKNILIVPGAGHIEMNLLKCVFKVLWQPYLQHIALLCGFRSPHALAYAKSCSNHHKSWQIFLIFLHGTLQEIVYMYLSDLAWQHLHTRDDLDSWVNLSKSSNVKYLWSVLDCWVIPLFLFRCGVRRNNPEVMLAARDCASTIFYGTGATTYQELIFRDDRMRLMAPIPVQEYLAHSEILSVSGHQSKGEGGDFVMEARNRRVKTWIPPGVPSEKAWLRSCRNLDKMEKMKSSLMSTLDLQEETGFYTITEHSLLPEVMAFRKWIRDAQHLDGEVTTMHTGLHSDQKMDIQLCKATSCCENNRQQYRTAASRGLFGKKGPKLQRIFVTSQDRETFEKPENKTIAELGALIESKLTEMQADDQTRTTWKQVSKGRKTEIVQFYQSLLDIDDVAEVLLDPTPTQMDTD